MQMAIESTQTTNVTLRCILLPPSLRLQEKKGAAKAAHSKAVGLRLVLEHELSGNLNDARIAGECRLRVVEALVAGSHEVERTRSSSADGGDLIEAARNELRMIQSVQHLRLELQFES